MCLLAAKTEFCAKFKKNRRYAVANSPKMKFKQFMTFTYTLGKGSHDLTVQGVCYWEKDRKDAVVKLGDKEDTDFKRQFTANDPRSGNICLKLRKRKNECDKFQIKFTAEGPNRVCVKNIVYMSDCAKSKSFCGKVI